MKYSCRFCGSKDVFEFYPARDIRDNEWFLYKCNSCCVYFLAPEPTEEQLKLAYDTSYYGEGKRKFGVSVEKFIDHFRKRKARYIASQIPENGKVLDFGCGNGFFLKHISELGKFNLYGHEIQGGAAERSANVKEIKLKVGVLHENDYPAEFFDAITMYHVIEHIEKPKEVLNILQNSLKKNGLFVFSFPNITGLQSKIFKGKWYHLDPPRHLSFFDVKDFIKIMGDDGFRLINKRWFSFEQNPYSWVQSILNCMCKKREILYERLKGNRSYCPQCGTLNIFIQKLFFVITLPVFTIIDIIESIFGISATVQLTFRKIDHSDEKK
jgi:SAM-dependent methyltransferase